MNRLRNPMKRTALATAGVLAVAASACGHSPAPSPPAPPSSTAPAANSAVVDGIDTRDPDAVINAALARVYSWRPDTDPDSAVAFDRADDLFTAAYIDEVGPTASGLATVTAAQWADWAAAHARITATATVTPADHPADTATTHQRVVAITQHITGPTGPPDIEAVAYVTATHTSDGWRVSLISPR